MAKKQYPKRGKGPRAPRDNQGKGSRSVVNSEVETGRNDTMSCAPNDPSWYAANPSLLKDAASYSFNNPIGNKVTLAHGAVSGSFAVPGVYSLRTMDVPGVAMDGTAPVNVAAKNIYSFVRHANSGHSNYDSPDLMIYLLAMDQVYAALAYMARAYGVMGTYSQTNRYLPQALMSSMRLDFNDFMANLADFRYYINSTAVKVGSMCVPKTMAYFTRHMWMYTNVYKDSESDKAGLYLYNPAYFFRFEPTTSTQGGQLVAVTWEGSTSGAGKLMKFSQLKEKVDSLINPILSDEDMNIMSGDILKAFTADGVFKMGPIPESYAIEPVYNEEVLNQINNATLLGKPRTEGLKIHQVNEGANAGNIVFRPVFTAPNGGYDVWSLPVLFNSYRRSPEPADVMVGSRLTVIGAKGANDTSFVPASAGSDIALEGEVYTFASGAGDAWVVDNPDQAYHVQKYMFMQANDASETVPVTAYNLRTWAYQEQFDWHPQMFIVPYIGGEGAISNVKVQLPFVDLDNYTLLHDSDLAKLHETALLSQLAVPQMGSWNNKLS